MRCNYGFRIVGGCYGERRLVDWQAAFAGHCAADPASELDRESYLSAFAFGPDFRTLLESTGSTAGYAGKTWAAWLWLDIDRAAPNGQADLPGALDAARRRSSENAARQRLSGPTAMPPARRPGWCCDGTVRAAGKTFGRHRGRRTAGGSVRC